MEKEARSKTRK